MKPRSIRTKPITTARKRAKVITFLNHKGGVAKTTTALNVCAALAKLRYSVMAVDLDPQANLTYCFRANKANKETIYNFLEAGYIEPFKVEKRLDLIPGDKRLIDNPKILENPARLRDCIGPLRKNYNCIILDTPPGVGSITYNAIAASDYVFIPLTAEGLPLQGLTDALSIINNLTPKLNPFLKIGGLFLTSFAGRRINLAIKRRLKDLYGIIMMDEVIRANISLAESPIRQMDIFRYAPKSHGAEDYMDLTEAIISRAGIEL